MSFRDVGIGVAGIMVGLVVGLIIPRTTPTPVQVISVTSEPVNVALTPRVLDSLELSFKRKFKLTSNFKAKADSLEGSVLKLKSEIISLNDSLGKIGSYTLEYYTDSLGVYGDTLGFVANAVNELAVIDFRPRHRVYQAPDRVDSVVFVPVVVNDEWYNHPKEMGIILTVGIVAGALVVEILR